MNLLLRPIAENDYAVIDGGVPVGRIRFARERTPSRWLWNITLPTPLAGETLGTADSLDDAKAALKAAWSRCKADLTPEAYASAIETMKNAKR